MSSGDITRHSDLWFDDGSIVLVADNVGFRVHRGLLARHSEVFRDMFSMPQPVSTEVETLEGCQVVPLTDTTVDLTIVLGILYDCGQNFYNASQDIDFRVVAAALELGTKYAIDAMRHEALRRITQCYPKDLVGSIEPENLKCAHSAHRTSAGCSIIWRKTDPILVFRIARRLGLDDFIPMALYRCADADISLSDLFSAAVERDGKLPVLSMQELADCVQAREYLSVQQSAIFEKFAAGIVSPDCATKHTHKHRDGPCHKAAEQCATSSLAEQFMIYRDVFFPMASWISRYESKSAGSAVGFCRYCVLFYKETIFKHQKDVWAHLRANFGSSSRGSSTAADEMT